MTDIDAGLAVSPVIPVLVVDDLAHARPLAEALVAGGLAVLEVTLRTPAALAVIAEMAKVPGAIVGAGTVLSPADLAAAKSAGARFIVSPGLTPTLGGAAHAAGRGLGQPARLPGARLAAAPRLARPPLLRAHRLLPAAGAPRLPSGCAGARRVRRL